MKKISLVFGLLLFTLIANAQTKVGTIDVDYIISKMPEISQVNNGMETYNTKLQDQMKADIARHDSLVKNYQDNSANFTADEKKDKENAIIDLEKDLQNFRQKASVMMQMKRNELSKPLYQKIDKAMQEVIKEEGYTQILHTGGNALAYADERYDITEKVMKKLGIKVEEEKAGQE